MDLSGYTRMTTTLDPEDVHRRVEPVLSALREVAESHGGHVDSVQGDGFLAVFGAPTAHADSPHRAVAAAMSMLAARNAPYGGAHDSHDIHIGIASGEVLVSRRQGRQSVVGAAVNLAARLSDVAVPGEVLVDEMSAALTATSATYGDPRTLSLQGFAGAVRALPLVGVGAAPSDATPALGRAEQLAALDRVFENVQTARSSGIVVVTGEAGLGKSRLVSFWCSRQSPVLVLRGSCRPYGSPLPLSALAEALSVGLGTDRDAVPEAADSLGLSDATALTDFLGLLPRQRAGSTREPDGALQLAARRLLEALTRPRPVVLVLEDIHWADGALQEVLHTLEADPIPGQLLVVATASDAVPGLQEVALPPLDGPEVAAVVEQRIGVRPDAAMLDLLLERSNGNPLWLVECLKLLTDRGQIAVEGECAVIRDGGEVAEVPASIRLLVSARLDALPLATKGALQRASAWPGEIPPDRWADAPEHLEALVAAGLLDRRPDGAVRFAHGLVREAVYGSVSRADRVAEHEALLAQPIDLATRAYAAREVQRLDVGPDQTRRQAVAERAVVAVIEHAGYLSRAHTRAARDVLLLAEDLVDEVDAIVPGACAALLTELANVLNELEERSSSIAVATRAVDLADLAADPGIALRARLALGAALIGTDTSASRRLAETVLLATEIDPSGLLRAQAWRMLADAHSYDDFAARQRCLEEAYRCFAATGAEEPAAAAARRLTFELSVTADSAFDHWLSVAEAATASDHIRGQAELGLIRAVVAQARGDWEESWESATGAMSLAEQVGMHQALVDAIAVAVEAATATGRRAALPGLLIRLGGLVQGHRARLRVTALCASAPALVSLGRDAEAARALRQAQDLLTAVGPNEETMLWSARAQCAVLAERHDEAEAAYVQAEELALQLGLTLFAQGCRLQQLSQQARRGGRPGLRDELLALAGELDAVRATSLAATARSLASDLEQSADPPVA